MPRRGSRQQAPPAIGNRSYCGDPLIPGFLPTSFREADSTNRAELSGRLHFYPSADTSSRESIENTCKRILHRTPKINGIANLAGSWNVAQELSEYIEEKSRAYASSAVPWTCNPSDGGGGVCWCTVNMGSSADNYPVPTFSIKAIGYDLRGGTRTWALDLSKKGIRVNMVEPGGTREPLSRSWFKKRERESMSKEVYRLLTRTENGRK
jgi:NAD(P)-dependent dehydrogenase (short-subunit alcohol dehydrogenase family)